MKPQLPPCPQCKEKIEVAGEKFDSQISCPHCGHSFNPMAELMKEGMKWFDEKVTTETAEIGHSQFVAGMKDGTMKVVPFKGNSYALIRGESRKRIFGIAVLCYLVGPLLLVPLWSWQQGNSRLLYGVFAWWASTFVTAKLGRPTYQNPFLGGLFVFMLAAWVLLGRHNYYTIFLTLSFFGCFCFMLADGLQQIFIEQSLLEDSTFFESAVMEQRIWIAKKTN